MTTRHADLSARLVARYGGTATLARSSGADESTYPPTPGTTETWTVQLIETGLEVEKRMGTMVEAGDLVAAMLPHPEVTPQIGDRLTTGGETYSITAVHPIRTTPGGAPAHWHVEAAR